MILARLCAREDPVEASLRFGLAAAEVEEIAKMPVERIRQYASAGMALFRVVPTRTPDRISGAAHVGMMMLGGRAFTPSQDGGFPGFLSAVRQDEPETEAS